jgi:hypothetical protein
MQAYRSILLISLFAFSANIATASVLKKDDLKGSWKLSGAKCTSGKSIDEVKGASLQFDGKHLSLIAVDDKTKNENVIDTDLFVIQEDLLSFPKDQFFVTVKIVKSAKDVLSIRFPVLGLSGTCPEGDLAVWNFNRKPSP